MRVGLFFGSFNPIHTGHLVIAEYLLEFSDLQEIWFVISPQNPLKEKEELAPERDRLNMLYLALPDNNPRLKVSELELGMASPSYTIDSLREFSRVYPGIDFVILMGSDSVKTLNRWKEYETLVAGWDIYVYPRENNAIFIEFPSPRFTLIDAPVLGISSTQIRTLVKNGQNVGGYVPDDVCDYIEHNNLYGVSQVHA
ncbi:MAG: nicotinate (nicotinamide) nucleotide adenylyltransferase [Bacteroidales bacterium]